METLGISPHKFCDKPLFNPVKVNKKGCYEASLPLKEKHPLILQKGLQDTENLFRKNLQLKDVC